MADNAETSFHVNNQENNDDMEVVTMVDVLKEEQELEEDANAVLGGSDEKNCTYSKGYLKRQALYACMTCIPDSKTDPSKRAGICLACSYSCHEGHDLIELYTKRNFRCDCGNNRFIDKKCSLEPEKCEMNEANSYNHNFSGMYCTCERPYPDPEDKIIDNMIQCVICEDWYHCRHLGVNVPPMNTYSEMICTSCISKHEFLLNYSGLAVTMVTAEEEKLNYSELAVVKVADDEEKLNQNTVTDEVKVKVETDLNLEVKQSDNSDNIEPEQSINSTESSNRDETTDCKMPTIKSDSKSAKFWPENWRQHLCTCARCCTRYEQENVSYLIDQLDTVFSYEEQGKAKALEANSSGESQYEQGMKALSSLDRIKQVEAISEYNSMKEQLIQYLQKFADNKKVVREEDIREFYSTLAARKKQKVEMSYFCR